MDTTFDPDLLAEFVLTDPGEYRSDEELTREVQQYRNLVLDSAKQLAQTPVRTTVATRIAARGNQLVCVVLVIPAVQLDIACIDSSGRKDVFRRAQLEERQIWDKAVRMIELQHVGMRVYAASQATSPFRRGASALPPLPNDVIETRRRRAMSSARQREQSDQRIRTRDLRGFDGYQWCEPMTVVGTPQRKSYGVLLSVLGGSDARLEHVKALQIHFIDVAPDMQILLNDACRTSGRLRLCASVGISEVPNRGAIAKLSATE